MDTADRKNTALFETMPVPQAVRTMAVPTVISQLIVLIYNIADTFFIGRTGNAAMVGGASLILPVFTGSSSHRPGRRACPRGGPGGRPRYSSR